MIRPLLATLALAVAVGAATPACAAKATAHATLGGGCFWAMQAEFEQLKGVESAIPGYAGGHVAKPTYEQVCSHTTGHAEVIDVTYDPAVLSYSDLLKAFFKAHDPTTVDRQGNDVGDSYRSIILTRTPAESQAARKLILDLNKGHAYPDPIVTQVRPLDHFYQAEGYHMHYYAQHPNEPYCATTVASEIARFRTRNAGKLK